MSAEVWAEHLRKAVVSGGRELVRTEDLAALMGDVAGLDATLLEARAQKAALVWVKTRLDADPRFNRLFVDKSELPWLDKLLAVARLRELASVRIVKIGKSTGLRYDVGSLAATHYGKKILDSLGHRIHRTQVDKEAYEAIRAACARLKLTLPETVEPTTTERFFASKETP